jgi:myosin-1
VTLVCPYWYSVFCATQYDCGKLGESNKDALDNDLLGLIKSSGDKLLTHLFGSVEPQSGGSTVASAGTRIRQQCQLLVTALMECSPHYVRW